MANKDFEKLIEDILENDSPFLNGEQVSQSTNSNKVAIMQFLVSPIVNRKSMELKQKAKRRKENIQLILGCMIFIIFYTALAADFLFTDSPRLIIYSLVVLGIISVVLICCLPIFMRFKENILEGRIKE